MGSGGVGWDGFGYVLCGRESFRGGEGVGERLVDTYHHCAESFYGRERGAHVIRIAVWGNW